MNITRIGKACSGCGCCEALCPKQCIEMTRDAEGFLYPKVDAAKCVDCGVCLARCPVHIARADGDTRTPLQVYAARATDEALLAESSSGGLFSLLARDVLKAGGVVYGARLDADGAARFAAVRDEAGLSVLRRSKYVQSELSNEIYTGIKRRLDAGESVLFSGCPCQVAALKSYLNKPYERLTTLDIVCHGVPSPLLFKTYLDGLGKRMGGKILNYRFRDKAKGWGMNISYTVNGRTHFARSGLDPYQQNFLSGNTYRESCYACPFARPARQGDATLGDYWGLIKEHPSFYDARGVSLLLVNTGKGAAAFERIKPDTVFIPSEFARASRHNQNLLAPTKRPAARDAIYDGLSAMPPEAYVRQKLKRRMSPGQLVRVLMPARLKRLFLKLTGGGSE